MDYTLYIDESGDQGLVNVDSGFPVFLLCGILISQDSYESLNNSFVSLKKEIWGSKKVIFHSRDIRKCEKEFSVLFDLKTKKYFYDALNESISSHKYTAIAAAIHKEKYIQKYGRLTDDVYKLSLSFIIERAIFYLDDLSKVGRVDLVVEKRGKKEDANLQKHFQKLLSRGTGFVSPDRLNKCCMTIRFHKKEEDINGLQLADLAAYPIARYVINSDRANPAYEIIKEKIYNKNGKLYGLKIFP